MVYSNILNSNLPTVQSARCLYPSCLLKKNFVCHMTFLRGIREELARKLREFWVECGKQACNDSAVACKGLKTSMKRIIFML